MEWITHPIHFIASTFLNELFANVVSTSQMPKTLNRLKTKLKLFLMFVIFTLFQTWPSNFLSIPCICLECPKGCWFGWNTNTMSPLNLVGRQWTFAIWCCSWRISIQPTHEIFETWLWSYWPHFGGQWMGRKLKVPPKAHTNFVKL